MINTAEKRGRWLVLVAAVMLVVVFVLSFALGKYPVPPACIVEQTYECCKGLA